MCLRERWTRSRKHTVNSVHLSQCVYALSLGRKHTVNDEPSHRSSFTSVFPWTDSSFIVHSVFPWTRFKQKMVHVNTRWTMNRFIWFRFIIHRSQCVSVNRFIFHGIFYSRESVHRLFPWTISWWRNYALATEPWTSSQEHTACVFLWINSPVNRFTVCLRPYILNLNFRCLSHAYVRAGTHGEISFDSFDSRSSSVYVNVNYSHEHTVNSWDIVDRLFHKAR